MAEVMTNSGIRIPDMPRSHKSFRDLVNCFSAVSRLSGKSAAYLAVCASTAVSVPSALASIAQTA